MRIALNNAKWKKLSTITWKVVSTLHNHFKQLVYTIKLPKKHLSIMALLKNKYNKQDKPDVKLIITKADELYKKKQYIDLYNMLNKYKHLTNSEIIWRLCRALHKLSVSEYYSKETQEEMINEAILLLENGLKKHEYDAELHKWLTVLLSSKLAYKGIAEKLEIVAEIKKHLLYASNLNCNDKTVYYMLGYLCYQMSSLTWIQQLYLNMFYSTPPECTMKEAYNYFLLADKFSPASVANTFMLGMVSLKMGQYFRASYYFGLTSKMSAYSTNDKKLVKKAGKLAKYLDRYDLSKNALTFLD